MIRRHRPIPILAALMLSAACGGSPPPAPPAQESRGAPASAHPPMGGEPAPAELAWTMPAGWIEETPSSSMRRAQYRIPAAGDAEGGECAVFYFGAGQGGDVQGNVERWTGQFTTPDGAPAQGKVTEIRTGDLAITRVEVAGTYHPTAMGMGGGSAEPRPGSVLLGAIVPGAEANWFIRCSGPEKTMQANRTAFDSLVASLRRAP